MTQKAVKQKLVEAYIEDAQRDRYVDTFGGERSNYAEQIFRAICTMYTVGLIDETFYYAISEFYYNGGIDEAAYKQRPDMFVRLSAKGVIKR